MSGQERKPIGFANYPGDATAAVARDIESGRAYGPNYMGEYMWPVVATFDPATNTTRVGFSLIPAEQVTS